MFNKTICYFDLETTGLDTNSVRIVEIYMEKHYPDKKTPVVFDSLVNPEMLIPAEASAVNNITDDMVKDSPKFSEISDALVEFLSDVDVFCGHVVRNYDLPILIRMIHETHPDFDFSKFQFIDTRDVAKKYIRFTVPNVYKMLTGKDANEKKLHRADYDIELTRTIMEELVKQFGEDKIKSGNLLSAQYIKGVEIDSESYVFITGQFKGESISSVLYSKKNPGYVLWMHNSPKVNFKLSTRLLNKVTNLKSNQLKNG